MIFKKPFTDKFKSFNDFYKSIYDEVLQQLNSEETYVYKNVYQIRGDDVGVAVKMYYGNEKKYTFVTPVFGEEFATFQREVDSDCSNHSIAADITDHILFHLLNNDLVVDLDVLESMDKSIYDLMDELEPFVDLEHGEIISGSHGKIHNFKVYLGFFKWEIKGKAVCAVTFPKSYNVGVSRLFFAIYLDLYNSFEDPNLSRDNPEEFLEEFRKIVLGITKLTTR